MTELILHHFAASPFSEKVRLVLGHKKLAWTSVQVPAIMPKPDVLALTGGYRRTPLLQIGADIFCDTALILDVLERLQPAPSLYPAAEASVARTVGQWADDHLFWAAVRHNRGPKGSGLGAGLSGEQARALFDDRQAMGFDLQWRRPQDASVPYQTYLRQLAGMLGTQDYLFGARPCVADFCAYHPLLLAHLRSAPAHDVLAPFPTVRAWLERLQAIGHGTSRDADAAYAIDVARLASPAMDTPWLPEGNWHDEHGIAAGSAVQICAESFGTEPSTGVLVAATQTHYSLRQHNPRVGTVHVHFPRIGYLLRQPEPERTTKMETHHVPAEAVGRQSAPGHRPAMPD